MKDGLGRTEVPTRACFVGNGGLRRVYPRNFVSDLMSRTVYRFGYDCVERDKTIYDIRRFLNESIIPPNTPLQVPLQDSDPKHGKLLVSAFLTHLQSLAEAFFEQNITSTVITIPAYLSDSDVNRDTLREIHTQASPYASPKPLVLPNQSPLKILRVLAAPTASLFPYGLYDASYYGDIHILAINVGASLEISAILLEDNVSERLSTIHTEDIGGDAFDRRLAEHLELEFGKASHGGMHEWMWHRKWNLTLEQKTMLKEMAERTKLALFSHAAPSEEEGVRVSFTELGDESSTVVTREIFHELNKDLYWRIVDRTMEALRKAAVQVGKPGVLDVSRIVLTGRSSYLSPIRELLWTAFPNATILSGANSDATVVVGTALHAGRAFSAYVGPLIGCCDDITPMDLMLSYDDEERLLVLIPRNSIIPTTRTRRVNVTTEAREMKIYTGYSRTAGVHGSIILGSIPIPPAPDSEEVEVKVEVSSEAEIFITLTGSETKFNYTYPRPRELWSDEAITQFIDEAEEYDRREGEEPW
ncbi:heat shock [Moniliophthora roreri]|nr:heat shock [Moniliophthora roreri]